MPDTTQSTPHTTEPWDYVRGDEKEARSHRHLVVTGGHAYVIAEAFQYGDTDRRKANVRRIAACVNACKGIDVESLERIERNSEPLASLLGAAPVAREQDALVADLVAAVEGLLSLNVFRSDNPREEIVAAFAVLRRARGEAVEA